jgi:hypothetical protein
VAAPPARPPWEDAAPDGDRRGGPDPAASVPPEPSARLAAAFAQAVGLTAVADALTSARDAQAARLTGWPLGRLLRGRQHGRRDPLRGLTAARASETAGQPADAVAMADQAQQSEVDNAITAFVDAVGSALPEPWSDGVREAARRDATLVPQALASAVHEAAAAAGSPPPRWWRLITTGQWLMTALAFGGVALSAVIAVVRATGQHQGWISEAALIPWLLLMAAAMLVLGYVTASSCRNLTIAAADRERETAEQAMHASVADVTHDLVLTPVGREIAQYERFRRELTIAAGSRPA